MLFNVANLINNAFASYDYAILEALHKFLEATNGFFTPFFKFISLLGEKGIFLILLSIILMLFKKTRKLGICIFGAIGCGAIFTNIILKDLIARPRPFIDTLGVYNTWWKDAGSVMEDGFSFPSGHATAASAFAMSVFLICDKKKGWSAFIFLILMGISRNYLMVHYPSDILGGIASGFTAAVIAYFITKLIYKVAEKYKDKKLFDLILNFDILDL